jgi:hypothetical protein
MVWSMEEKVFCCDQNSICIMQLMHVPIIDDLYLDGCGHSHDARAQIVCRPRA